MKNRRLIIAIIPFLVLIAILTIVILVFRTDALGGAAQVAMLLTTAISSVIAITCFHTSWSDLEEAMTSNIKSLVSAILILFFIGAVAGSWMISGIVPTMIYYGLKILSPAIFLFATCVICGLVSLMTGSSWTTIATIGVALIGIGQILGFSAGWTAGAIISGAYFGDKLSPLSDTNVLASSLAGIPLFTHVRYMLYTTIPTFVITLIVFLCVSLTMQTEASISVQSFSDSLQDSFCISPWLFIVPVLTGVMIAFKLPALAVLLLSALNAEVAALIAQPDIIAEIGGSSDLTGMFRGVIVSLYGDTAHTTGFAQLDTLIATHGMCGMLDTVFLIICAGAFGGVLQGSGIMREVTDALARQVSGRKSLTAVTEAIGISTNAICADQYLSILMTVSISSKLYEKMGFEQRLLTRTVSDSSTVTSVLVPWNTCGMTQASVLHVPTIEYLPYCIFNLLAPVVSFVMVAIGYKVKRIKQPF
ncbi:MAG: sodium:proton antiporter [Paludibacteraceae bacterium]|nr:sodium:proton antiporter [Paludibacteraceae bacterium]